MQSSNGSEVCGVLQAVFPAKTSVWRAAVQASMASDRGCGGTCGGLFPCADPDGHLLRMFLLSALEELTGFSLTWKDSGTPARRSWWVLGRSEHPTEEIGSGSSAETWGTHTANGGKRSPEFGMGRAMTPQEYANGWPTPRCEDSEQTGAHAGVPDTLTSAARYFPTPAASDSDRGPESKETRMARGSSSAVNLVEAASWATPNQRDWKDSGPTQGNRHTPNLGTQAWATPGAGDEKHRSTPNVAAGRAERGKQLSIHDQVYLAQRDWATPTAACVGGNTSRGGDRIGELLLGGQIHIGPQGQDSPNTNGKRRGSLNPAWVAQLMIGRGGELWLSGVKPA
jgi:hypothetical protein